MNRKNWMLLNLIAVVLLFAACEKKITSTTEENDILVTTSHPISLGEILQFHDKKYLIILTNSGNKTVEILDITPSCTCTSLQLERYTIKPKEKIKLRLSVNPGDRFGKFRSIINLKWKFDDSTTEEKTTIALDATATRLLRIEPQTLDYGNLPQTEEIIYQKIYFYKENSEIPWNKMKITRNGKTIPVKTITDKKYEAEITIDPKTLPLGWYKQELIVHLKNGDQVLPDLFTIPITAKIVGDIEFEPLSLFLGIVSRDKIKTGQIKIYNKTGSACKIISVKSTHSISMITKFDSSESKNTAISYEFKAGDDNGDAPGKLEITVLSDGRYYQVQVPYIVYIK